jgi:hypothetical protein
MTSCRTSVLLTSPGRAAKVPGEVREFVAALFQRNVNSNKMLHRCPSMILEAHPDLVQKHHHSGD